MAWEIRAVEGGTWHCIFDGAGNYVTACASNHRAQLISSAPELAQALRELLEEMDKITEYYEDGTCHTHACQQARKLLGRLGI